LASVDLVEKSVPAIRITKIETSIVVLVLDNKVETLVVGTVDTDALLLAGLEVALESALLAIISEACSAGVVFGGTPIRPRNISIDGVESEAASRDCLEAGAEDSDKGSEVHDSHPGFLICMLLWERLRTRYDWGWSSRQMEEVQLMKTLCALISGLLETFYIRHIHPPL
jgi:hypothetical protein